MTTLAQHHEIASTEARACAAADAVGLIAKRSRLPVGSEGDRDGFMILDPKHQRTLAGEKYDMSAEDVIAYCERLRSR